MAPLPPDEFTRLDMVTILFHSRISTPGGFQAVPQDAPTLDFWFEFASTYSYPAVLRIAPLAEKVGVTVILEMLNSRVDHRGFQGDTSAYGIAVAEKVNSPRVRLLYDIYHMQISEGDIIRSIRTNGKYFAHYHTAGNPGRNEIGDTQELNYPAIAKAITDTGYTGWIAHEFSPRGDKEVALVEARDKCTV